MKVGLSWIPFIKDLWATSIFGLFVYLVGVVASSIYYSATDFHAPPDSLDVRWQGLPHFFGKSTQYLGGQANRTHGTASHADRGGGASLTHHGRPPHLLLPLMAAVLWPCRRSGVRP
jgi:hypothetical protein